MNIPVDLNSAEPVNISEIIKLGAVDNAFFGKTFFPKTLRQATPNFHREMDKLLDSDDRLVCIKAFRGSAKTTKARVLLAKRIAYGLARTCIVVGKSEAHAVYTLRWLRKQVQHNRFFADTFKLTPGNTWSDVASEIIHGVEGHTCTILALGMTGSVRGINIDDYRPDFILLDDPLDEENTATPLQRQKTEELIYGSLKETLAPKSEAPFAKMVMLQTPQNAEDISMKADKDPEWASGSFPVWTKDTLDLPIHLQCSVWEDRLPSEELREEKKNAIRRNQVSIFTREKEVRIVSREASSFRMEWVQYYKLPPENMFVVMAIDPVPPPSPAEIEKGLRQKDFEAFVVYGKKMENRFLLHYEQMHGHDPSWTIMTFFNLVRKYRPKRVLVESVAYQRVLAWLLRSAMEEKKIWVPVFEYTDRRSKYNRIVDAHNGLAANGKLFVKEEHSDYVSQFIAYPNVAHDDLLDAGAIALSELSGENNSDEDMSLDAMLAEERAEIKALEYRRGAP